MKFCCSFPKILINDLHLYQVTPLTSLKFAEFAAKAGFPDGVINIIPGSGKTLLT